jgi:molybdopterin molybdotransferase
MTEVAEAEALILAQMPRFAARHEALSACVGRVLAEDIQAERDQPPFDRVTMDGIAIAYRDFAAGVRSFEVVGTQAAGAEPLAVTRAQCAEVMTGAVLPAGADTVVPVERVRRDGATAIISADAAVAGEQFVHRRASDRAQGTLCLRAGTRLGPPEIAVVAGAGPATA